MIVARGRVPRLLLGAGSLELPARTTRDRMQDITARFREPESLAVALVKAIEAGAEAVYSPPGAALRGALAALGKPLPVLLRLPTASPIDDLHWQPALAREGGGGSGWSAMAALLPTRSELATRVVRRFARDTEGLPARVARGVAVASEVTDLALAGGSARFFERTLRAGRSRFGIAGFETRHLAALLERLRAWGLAPDFVLGPIATAARERGAGLPRPAVLPDAGGIPVIAADWRGGGTLPLEPAATRVIGQGAWGLAADLVDLDDLAGDLRALAAMLRRDDL